MNGMIQESLIDWSRAQFALTACYHWLFVPLTLGLAVVMAVMESIYVKTQDVFWKRTAQFWQKIFGINFAIGVATGIILEFEFGTNWSNYSWFVGDIFGAPLAIEGILAFFMEATFIAVMFFGWNKVSQRFHLASTWLTGLGATISAWWILVANSWMQHPVGMTFNPDTVRNEMVDFWAVAFQPIAVTKFFHTVSSGWMTGAVFVVGVSCWYLLKKRNQRFALASIRVASVVGLVALLTVMFTGDRSGIEIGRHQPMKLAAAEGLEKGSTQAPFSIVPGVEVPGVLSILATHDINGFVPGTEDILNGYTDNDGNLHLSADEKMKRGQEAVAAFKEYRTLWTHQGQRRPHPKHPHCLLGLPHHGGRWLCLDACAHPGMVVRAQRHPCRKALAALHRAVEHPRGVPRRTSRMGGSRSGPTAMGHTRPAPRGRGHFPIAHSLCANHLLHFPCLVHAAPYCRSRHHVQGHQELELGRPHKH